MAFARSRQALAIAGVLGLALGATACGTGNDKKSDKASSPECAAYEKYQGHDGKKVTMTLRKGVLFHNDKEGSGEFEAQLGVRVDGGNAPDLAFIPQPGLLKRFVDSGKIKTVGADTKALAEQNFTPDWLKYSTVDGKLYGVPLGSNVKSYVWYSPKTFKEKGWQVPTTWDQLLDASKKISDLGRPDQAQRPDRGERHQAVVRRHRVR